MKTWITIPVSELENLDYSTLKITNPDTAIKNIAGDTAIIKWAGEMPVCVNNISSKGMPMNHNEVLALLETPEWFLEEFV